MIDLYLLKSTLVVKWQQWILETIISGDYNLDKGGGGEVEKRENPGGIYEDRIQW